jgi:hypothetical protein
LHALNGKPASVQESDDGDSGMAISGQSAFPELLLDERVGDNASVVYADSRS